MNAGDESIRAASRALLDEAGLSDLAAEAAFTPLAGGSDRSFTRIAGTGTSVVLLSQDPGWEIDSYVEIGGFLAECGVAVPKILASDKRRGFVLMEDIGDLHLEEAISRAPEKEVLRRYREAVSILVSLQTGVTAAMNRRGLLAERVFAEDVLLGETDYFVREFIDGFCRVDVPHSWERERRLLAASLAAEPLVFMHRDFQSRNLLVKDDRLRIIDFQTAHRGPGVYDAASLLKDAYHPLPTRLRRALAEELHAELVAAGARPGEKFEEYYRKFVLAGIQRNLQALAAFAKLGLRKGKRLFLESIPPGLDLLEEGIVEHGDLEALPAMVEAIRARIDEGLMKGL